MEGQTILIRRDVHFYVGTVQAISPPDVYGVLLSGERGNKPHIYSREDLLAEGVRRKRKKRRRHVATSQRPVSKNI